MSATTKTTRKSHKKATTGTRKTSLKASGKAIRVKSTPAAAGKKATGRKAVAVKRVGSSTRSLVLIRGKKGSGSGTKRISASAVYARVASAGRRKYTYSSKSPSATLKWLE